MGAWHCTSCACLTCRKCKMKPINESIAKAKDLRKCSWELESKNKRRKLWWRREGGTQRIPHPLLCFLSILFLLCARRPLAELGVLRLTRSLVLWTHLESPFTAWGNWENALKTRERHTIHCKHHWYDTLYVRCSDLVQSCIRAGWFLCL